MRKISFASYVTSIVVSVLFGGLLATGVVYMVVPAQKDVSVLPVINYENVLLANNSSIIAGSSPFALPAMPTPVLPDVPDMQSVSSTMLEVIGVLPPDVVILQRGSESITAYVGDKTKFGTIEEIYDNGALVDGRFVNLRLKTDNYNNFESDVDEDDE